jgi:dipeptide transport system substrate-binding protein
MRLGLTAAATGLALSLGMSGAAVAKTLVYCSEGSPEGFNPQLATAGTTFDASSRPIYNRLVEFERGTTKITPGLAESWEVTGNGTVYTFKLRKGVKWQTASGFTPTRDFNADDVMFTMNRQWKPDHPFHKVSGGKYEYFNSMGLPDILASIDKVDDSTVRFTLKQPEAPFLANMAMDWASIFSAEYADKMMTAKTPEKLDTDPVGTGPFYRVSYQKDAIIRYKAHPNYWAGKAKLDDLVYAITPDASVRYAKLKAGECHVMPYPNPADLAAMEKDPTINLMKQEGLNIGYWAFNTEKKPFDDARVRRALSMAVNKKAIVDAVFLGSGVPAVNPIPPTIWSYNPNIKDIAYDPAGAKKLLADAGMPNGFEMDLWAMPVQRPYNPNARRMAEIIQADLAKINVKANIVTYEWAEYLKRTKNGDHQSLLLGWTGDNGDPDNFLHTLLGCDAAKDGTNRARWCYKPFDDLVVAAKRTPDLEKRTELYMKAQEVFKDQAPWYTVAHSVQYKPVRKEVIDFKLSPFGAHVFYGVDIKE